MEKLRELLAKIPVIPLLFLWIGKLGWNYYSFTTDPTSALLSKRSDIQSAKAENAKLQDDIKKVNDFLRNLEATKVELRNAAQKLDSFKATISDQLDVAEFTRMTTTEAQRIGLTVVSIRPLDPSKKEFYVEQPFEFAFRGAYVQLLMFMDRLSNLQKVVRVDNFDVRPLSSATARIVELQGTMQIKAYRYQGTKADELGRDTPLPAALPAQGAAKPKGAGA